MGKRFGAIHCAFGVIEKLVSRAYSIVGLNAVNLFAIFIV